MEGHLKVNNQTISKDEIFMSGLYMDKKEDFDIIANENSVIYSIDYDKLLYQLFDFEYLFEGFITQLRKKENIIN